MDRFYNLDKQEFKTVSCNIEVPLTINQVKQTKAQLEPMKDNIELRENLKDFSLTYSKNGKLNINYPSIDIMIISEKGMTDPIMVKKGIEIAKNGFKMQMEGAGMQLQGFFEAFTTPKKGILKIKKIKDDKTTYTLEYEKENDTFNEIYLKNQRKVKQKSKNGDEISSVENYKNIANNKLLITDAQVITKNASMGNIEMNVTFSYENVKNVIFPSRMEIQFKQTVQNIKQEGQFDIYLKNCILR